MTLKILTVATAWGSKHGGVNVFNYRMCCGLADLGHSVTCYVKQFTAEDLVDAIARGVTLKSIDRPSDDKWSLDDVGHIKYADIGDLDVLVIHDIVSKAFLDHFPLGSAKPIVAAFIHTLYSDTDYFGDLSDDKRREKTAAQFALIEKAHISFTSGSWIADQLINAKPALAGKIRPFIPGRIDVPPRGVSERGAITTFGRLSLGDDKKQASSVLSAYSALASSWRRDSLNAEDLPDLRLLGVRCDVPTQQEIKKSVFEASGWAARVEFLSFNHYYEFESSATLQIVADSRVVVTPSIVESFGLTSLEAIGLGIPLIAGRRSGFAHDLKKLVSTIPESAIDWLEVSDFDDLPNSLSASLRRVLKNQSTYNRGAMVLAENIAAAWPTWKQSCRQWCAELAKVRMSQVLEQPTSTWASSNAFAALKSMAAVEPGAHAFESGPDISRDRVDAPVESGSPEPARWPLDRLAREAYRGNLIPGGVLERLVRERYQGKTCTALQQQVADELTRAPLHNYQDVLLCGGTSSGKTMMAEVLFGLANNTDFLASRIIYLAPTKALAKERFREWSRLFKPLVVPRCDANVIVSTGEDHSNDRALARGEFLIACLVFEKANVILSTSADLVKRLTMIVVDELHMIADIHRGPLIETLLAKLKYEKRRRQRRDDLQLPLRIVGITTERSTAEGFGSYLTNLDRQTDQLIRPLPAIDVGRPTIVRHILVEPENSGESPYRETPIATFAASEPLHLSQEALAGFAASLPVHERGEDLAMYRGGRGRKLKHADKYVSFLRDWLIANPHGKRLLAFIGSKADQVTLADRLQSEIKRTFSLAERAFNVDRLEPVLEQVKNDDTSIAIEVLSRALSRGVFIHNADINSELRAAVEDYLGEALPLGAASEVIVATETLSYGVNLALDDVALLSLEFPASERNQEYGATPKLLTRCAFANMCGRAGRLNQRGGEAVVYVWPITDNESSATRLVEIFYCDEDAVRSKIVHGDDKDALERLKKAGRTSLAPVQFTYPFVKAVLDGLRFTGGAPGLNGATRRADATLEELEDEFTDHLLYSLENKENPSNASRLRESVRLVIEESMDANLELVKKSGRGFKITQLGSSIIDTGTEISTLEPLKRALETLLRLLRPVVAADDIPVELLLLPIVVQNEAHRQIISGMPELRTDVARGDNRRAMLEWVGETFGDRGFTPSVLAVIGAFLAECDADPRHAPSGDTSSEFVHDACLRVFCGLLLWVSGEAMSGIHAKLRVIGVFAGTPVQINTNFAAFAERISWKLLFLCNLMRFTRSQAEVRGLQTKARRLNTRLRLGCAENALPFLAKDDNRKSMISRRTAHELLRAGATPKSISSGEFDLDAYSNTLRSQIRTQVRSYIRSSFHHLKNEFVFSAANQGADTICRAYWEFADEVIRKSTESGLHTSKWPETGRDDVYVLAVPGLVESEAPRVRLREGDGVLELVGHRLNWQDDTRIPVDAVKWQVQASYGVDTLRSVPTGVTMVVVDFPWLLRSVPSDVNVLRMSPAAFGILLTLIARSFFRDSVVALELLSAGAGAISSVDLMDRLHSELLLNQLPEALFDAWAGYWDAE